MDMDNNSNETIIDVNTIEENIRILNKLFIDEGFAFIERERSGQKITPQELESRKAQKDFLNEIEKQYNSLKKMKLVGTPTANNEFNKATFTLIKQVHDTLGGIVRSGEERNV